MNITNQEKHLREIFVSIDAAELTTIIRKKIAEACDLPPACLEAHGTLEIVPNMVGSPERQSGFKAVFRATIPLPPNNG